MMKEVKGQFITINGERFYEIANYNEMQPFFISLASDTDLWMYLSSTGGLTCGRRSPGEALFPYYTDDKITEGYEFTGPRTIINDWIPFSDKQQPVYDISRKIAKSLVGNQIVFCEENHTLGLRFSYLWAPAGKHGWVRRATLENLTNQPVDIDLTDSLRNILPAGVDRKTQNEFSTLVDGYKRTEIVGNLGLFRMEAILVDRAEPSESLTCNTVCCLGLPNADYSKTESKGVRGAFIAHSLIHSFTHLVQRPGRQPRCGGGTCLVAFCPTTRCNRADRSRHDAVHRDPAAYRGAERRRTADRRRSQ